MAREVHRCKVEGMDGHPGKRIDTWHATPRERRDLLRAITHNCTCEFGPMGTRITCCSAHRMLVEDQRALNGLLFGRRMAERLRREEGLPGATTWRAHSRRPGPNVLARLT
jgi:hypothetical protein